MRVSMDNVKRSRCYILFAALLSAAVLLFVILAAVTPRNLEFIDIKQKGYCSDAQYLTADNVGMYANVYRVYEKNIVYDGEEIILTTNNSWGNVYDVDRRRILPYDNNPNYVVDDISYTNNINIRVYALTNIASKEFVMDNVNIHVIQGEDCTELYFYTEVARIKGLILDSAINNVNIKFQYYILIKDVAEK